MKKEERPFIDFCRVLDKTRPFIMDRIRTVIVRGLGLVSLCVAQPVWAQIETREAESGGHLWRLIGGADPVVKLVMLVLVGMSVVCWAIIVFKYKEIKRSTVGSDRFHQRFWRSKNLDDLVTKSALPQNPMQTIFRKGITDLIRRHKGGPTEEPLTIDRVRQQVDRATEDEVAKIERYIPFLATTGSSAPYIGLFGTVWGILAAFWEIGKAGTSSLAVVGPYIAEALIATALGLAAAIPAVIGYNYFVTRIRGFTRHVGIFSEDLLDRIDREYFVR